jgi:hypothetical protein
LLSLQASAEKWLQIQEDIRENFKPRWSFIKPYFGATFGTKVMQIFMEKNRSQKTTQIYTPSSSTKTGWNKLNHVPLMSQLIRQNKRSNGAKTADTMQKCKSHSSWPNAKCSTKGYSFIGIGPGNQISRLDAQG